MKRIPSLDGLRAVSIALVVMGHWAELQFHSSVAGAFANLGVRIFFLISGFLITTLLLSERKKTGSICVREFYVRRAYRILPAAMVFMAIAFIVFWRDLRWYHMAAAAFYVTNFYFTHPWYLGHLWSLSVEEQFYLLWPGGLKKWYRHGMKILLGVVALAPLYRVGCHLAGLRGQADETFPAVADVLAVGCLLAILAEQVPPISKSWALAMCGVVVAVPTYWGLRGFHSDAILLFILWPLMHVSIAGLILHVVRRPYAWLNARPVVWLGQISYSLYLWQQLFVFGKHGRPWYGVIAAVAAASASYYIVEKPMLKLRERRARKMEAAYGMAA